jgi:hypothetical protein
VEPLVDGWVSVWSGGPAGRQRPDVNFAAAPLGMKGSRVRLGGARAAQTLGPRTIARVEFGSPAPFIAFVLGVVGGTLLATGHYVGGAMAALLGVVIYGLWWFARERGDDDRHTLW